MRVLFFLFLAHLNFGCPPINDDQSMETIQHSIEENLTIELPSNVATGKSWLLVENSDSTRLKLVSKNYISSPAKIDGKPGKDHFEFAPMKKGTVHLAFVYHYPFEKVIPKDAERKHFKIVIQ